MARVLNDAQKQLQKARGRKYYEKNRELCIARARAQSDKRRNKGRHFLAQYKSDRGCSSCEESDVRCLDFHHRNPAEKDFNIGAKTEWPIARLLEEAEKCIILCSNCHRKLHFREVSYAAH